MNEAQLYNHLLYNQYDKLLFHFINYKMFQAIERLEHKPKVAVWIHGFEAEAWYTRYYNYLASAKTLNEQLRKKMHIIRINVHFLKN